MIFNTKINPVINITYKNQQSNLQYFGKIMITKAVSTSTIFISNINRKLVTKLLVQSN